MTETTNRSLPAEILRKVLVERIQRNPAYSLRAFARDLGVSHTYLSLVINGRKRLSAKRAYLFAQSLALPSDAFMGFFHDAMNEAKAQKKAKKDLVRESVQLEVDRFRTVSQWYHVAILDLTNVKGFKSDPQWIAEKLGISATECKSAIERLERLGLLKKINGKMKKTDAVLVIPTSYSTSAVKSFHEQMIHRALGALSADSFDSRDITGTTMAIDPALLPLAKKKIQKFRREMLRLLSVGDKASLYQLNVQLFSLTREDLSNQGESI